jgi:hypothetical protein
MKELWKGLLSDARDPFTLAVLVRKGACDRMKSGDGDVRPFKIWNGFSEQERNGFSRFLWYCFVPRPVLFSA